MSEVLERLRKRKWEYLVVESVKHEDLNDYGKEGWELASISHGGGYGVLGITNWIYIFKRPKQ